MKHIKIFILVIFCSFQIKVMAASITVEEPFEVLKVNEQTYQSNFFTNKTTVTLALGRQVILLQYKKLFDDTEYDDHTIVRSEPFIVIFDIIADHQLLKLVPPELPDLKSAKTFIENPSINLIDINAKSEIKSEVMLLTAFEQHQFRSALQAVNKNSTLATATLTNTAKLNDTKVKSSSHAADASIIATKPNKDSRALNMLYYWWQEASNADKQHFFEQIQKNKE